MFFAISLVFGCLFACGAYLQSGRSDLRVIWVLGGLSAGSLILVGVAGYMTMNGAGPGTAVMSTTTFLLLSLVFVGALVGRLAGGRVSDSRLALIALMSVTGLFWVGFWIAFEMGSL